MHIKIDVNMKRMLRPGFEPESLAREAKMIGRTTLPEHAKSHGISLRKKYVSTNTVTYSPHINVYILITFQTGNVLTFKPFMNKRMNFFRILFG